jgi:TolA-binding protein
VANLATAYLDARQPEKAVPLAHDFLEGVKKGPGADALALAALQAQVAYDLLRAGQFAAAEPILRDCLAIREKKEPDAWTTFNTQSLLGGALLGQKKYAEAEPLLLKGYQGMKKQEAKIPPQGKVRLSEALERLARLYEATNKPDEARKWRAERAKYPEAKNAAAPEKK